MQPDTLLTLASVVGAMLGAGVAAYQARARRKRRRRRKRPQYQDLIR